MHRQRPPRAGNSFLGLGFLSLRRRGRRERGEREERRGEEGAGAAGEEVEAARDRRRRRGEYRRRCEARPAHRLFAWSNLGRSMWPGLGRGLCRHTHEALEGKLEPWLKSNGLGDQVLELRIPCAGAAHHRNTSANRQRLAASVRSSRAFLLYYYKIYITETCAKTQKKKRT